MPSQWIPTATKPSRGRRAVSRGRRVQWMLGSITLGMAAGSVAFALVPATAPVRAVTPVLIAVAAPPIEPQDSDPVPTSTASTGSIEPEARLDQVAVPAFAVPVNPPRVEPEQLVFVVNKEGVVVAETFESDDGALDPGTTTTTTQTPVTTVPESTVTTEDFGSPRLWLSGVSVEAAELNTGTLPVVLVPRPEDARGCYLEAKTMDVSGRNEIAQMVNRLFECMTMVSGLGDVSPTAGRVWNGEERWGFESLAQQVAAEAVVVAYCESKGFSPSAVRGNNPWGYGGVFQMGGSEMGRFGGSGLSKYDPVDNTYAAANYFLHQYRVGGGWGGWSPWAVVNTNFDDEINNQVKVPVLPRFGSSDPGYRGRRGPELPEWAVDPWSWQVPGWGGCPFTGGRWAAATPLE